LLEQRNYFIIFLMWIPQYATRDVHLPGTDFKPERPGGPHIQVSLPFKGISSSMNPLGSSCC